MSQNRLWRSENLATLCEQLRSERLLVSNEQTALQNLNAKVKNELTELYKLIWVCSHERVALYKLIHSDPSVSPENCNQLMQSINSAQFYDGYKGLGHFVTLVSELYRCLLKAPRTMAEFLNAAEKLNLNAPLSEMNRAIFNVIYGSCVFPYDEKLMLDLLAHLISLQLLSSPDPRLVLRKGNITFTRMYKYFLEELVSAKIFLTAALHEPVIFLLSQNELFLDIDPAKSPIRFPSAERMRRFGSDEMSRSYKEKVAKHRQLIVDKLVAIGEKFIEGITQAMSYFPLSLIWLVRQLYTSLIERKRVTKNQAALICTDLIFTCFLCSAIINPEPLGIISDTPISYIARFNLIQVGQILQTLALLPYEQPPFFMEELLQRFDQNAMAQIVKVILNSDSISLESIFPNVVNDTDGSEVFCRKSCVGTMHEINIIQLYLKSAVVEEITDLPLRKSLKNIIKKLPMEFENASDVVQKYNTDQKNSEINKMISSRSNSSGKLRNLADKVQIVASKGHQRLKQNANQLSKNINSSSTFYQSSQTQQQNAVLNLNGSTNFENYFLSSKVEVYYIPLFDEDTPLGLASEESIMQIFQQSRLRKHKNSETEKRAQFVSIAESVVSDRTTDVASDEEVDNSSSCSSSSSNNADEEANDEDDDEDGVDDVEDISTLPDNLSDVAPISANVSARGSPSLSGERNSGRDTPFSGNTNEQNENVSSIVPGAANIFNDNKRILPSLPVTVRKQNREGLEEKFGKFGLPPQDPSRYHDETYSLVSDSWSTDVVPSDNEGFIESRSDATANNSLPHTISSVSQANQNYHLQHNFFLPTFNNNSTFNNLQPSNDVSSFIENNYLQPVSSHHNPQSNVNTTTQQILNQVNTLTCRGSASAPNLLNNINGFAQNNIGVNNLLFDMDEERLVNSSANNVSNDRSVQNIFLQHQHTNQTNSQSKSTENSSLLLEEPYYNPKNLTQCKAFFDAKRKLRLVLSCASNVPMFKQSNNFFLSNQISIKNCSSFSQNSSSPPLVQLNVQKPSSSYDYDDEAKKLNELLQVLLAETINSRERTQSAQIREVQRCLTVFDNKGIRKLLRTLKDECRKRTAYILYLQQSKTTLLQLDYYLSRTKMRIQREQSLTAECFIEILVRLTLAKKDLFMRQFVHDFQQLKAQDEKIDAVDKTLSYLYECLLSEPMWRFAPSEHLDYARKSMERALMAHIFIFALYPNGEADHCRDELFYKSMQRLAAIISVDHPDLGVSKKFYAECPWPSAQAEIAIINAYRSPRDKVACVVRCCETIENLMALSCSNRGENTSADDILPILVFVLLQANPPTLLSNIQYVKDFYAPRMQGEEAYWWTQFTSSVEFIKQLLTKF